MAIQREVGFPDFVVGGNYASLAVYPISPDILKKEPMELIGVPFFFDRGKYDEITLQQRVGKLQARGIERLSREEYDNLLKNVKRIESILPEEVRVRGILIPLEKIVRFGAIFGRYNDSDDEPSSFGIPPYNKRQSLRTREDYRRMVDFILPSVRKEREENESHAIKLKEALIRLGFLSSSDSKRQITYSVIGDYRGRIQKKFIDRSYTEYKGLRR